jgi:Cellulase (glycosyl hydrolase family 5)
MKSKSIKLLLSLFFVIFSSQQVHAMTTNGTQMINSDGEVIELKAVNWFGFNNQSTMVDGLWNSSDSTSFDFATVVYRMQLLGFNAIRLPFSFLDLYQLAPKNYTQSCTLDSQSQIQASVTNPSVTVPVGTTIPAMISPPSRVAGACNSYLPNDTTLNRFLWVINFFAKNGFYVLIDDHQEDSTVLTSQSQWIQDWVKLATAIANDPISRKMVMFDLLNEADGFGIQWKAANGKPGLSDLYLSAMDALYQVIPEALFFVEGTGQGGIGANWGDGFVTDATLISQNGLSDPNPFFQTLLTKPYVNQVVISPHVYPPSVTNASANFSGTGLWNRLDQSFGYLTKTGYCNSQTCKLFPVAIGEFGSRFTDSRDLDFLKDFALYLNNNGAAATGKHQAIPHWFYWDWNPNSGDTGGLVLDDWVTIIWEKINYLTGIGLKPWYTTNTPPTALGTLCVSIKTISDLTKDQLCPISVGNYSYALTDFNTPLCQSVTTGNYTVTAPTLMVGNVQYTASTVQTTVIAGQTSTVEIVYQATPIVSTGAFAINVQPGTPWVNSVGGYKNVINCTIQNTGTTDVNVPWSIKIYNSSYTAVEGAWNIEVDSFSNHTVNGSTTAANPWENLKANNGNSIGIGMILSSS